MRYQKFLIILLIIFLIPIIFVRISDANSTPIISVRVEPLPFNALTGVSVEPILSEDSPECIFEYRWFLNGEENPFETTEIFPGSLLRRGDKLSVVVIPVSFFGDRLDPFVSLPIEVINSSPQILSIPQIVTDEFSFTYQVEAIDVDGDILHYSLDPSAEGVLIDEDNGLLKWVPSNISEQAFTTTVVVQDDYGGRAEQKVELTISEE